jgi:hypothetical protein
MAWERGFCCVIRIALVSEPSWRDRRPSDEAAVVGLVVPFAALRQFGPIESVSAVTLQALSGAGYPGVSSKPP